MGEGRPDDRTGKPSGPLPGGAGAADDRQLYPAPPAEASPLAGMSDAALLAAAQGEWRVTEHPLLPWFSDGELVAILRRPGGAEEVQRLYQEREERIRLSGDTPEADALRFGFELAHWKDADAMQKLFRFLYVAGGKRATKSERAARRFVKSALYFPRGSLWAMQGNSKTSIETQQGLVWKYLPREIRALNGKQDRRKVFNVNYSVKNGFADGILVLPNGTKVHFLTYEMEVKDYQGWAIGSPWKEGMALTPAEQRCRDLVKEVEGEVENLGFWLDENAPLPWVETAEQRCATHDARGVWTFSTTDGITPAISEVLGQASVTLESRAAELLPHRINLPGLPAGHMPYRKRCARSEWGAMFFFTEFNPFGTNYENIKKGCVGRTTDYVMENAYGWARQTRHRAFPKFSGVNVIARRDLPRRLTRYMLTDPGDASRNWASMWVGVDAGGRHFIYRDWPDMGTYGEWAVPSEDPKQPDGKRGPAQRSLGFGVEQLAETWRALEEGDQCLPPAVGPGGQGANRVHDGRVRSSPAGLIANSRSQIVEGNGEGRERVFERFIDPRAAETAHIERHGGTTLHQQFAGLPDPPDGPGPMFFTPWSGVEKSIGYTHVNDLLFWDEDKPLCWPTNAPRLYVVEDCKQVIWMFSNFTGLGGDRAGGKDFADLVRGMALADLQYYESNELRSTAPGKGY